MVRKMSCCSDSRQVHKSKNQSDLLGSVGSSIDKPSCFKLHREQKANVPLDSLPCDASFPQRCEVCAFRGLWDWSSCVSQRCVHSATCAIGIRLARVALRRWPPSKKGRTAVDLGECEVGNCVNGEM